MPINRSQSPRHVDLHVLARYTSRKVYARIGVVGEPHVAEGAAVELELYHYQAARAVDTHRFNRLLPAFGQELSFSLHGFESGTCWFRAWLIDRYGQRLEARIIQQTPPAERPAWLGSSAGVSRDVPAPWTPLKSRSRRDKTHVNCWGRRYTFTPRTIVDSINTDGEPLLDGPVVMDAVVNGRSIRGRVDAFRTLGKAGDRVVIDTRLRGARLAINARTEVEFDGMVRFDWMLKAHAPIQIDRLTLDVPLVKSVARYLYSFPGEWGSASNVGALPSRSRALPFRPLIWIGDEQRGLSWFFESDENWFCRRPDRCVRLVRQRDRLLLRFELVTQPVKLQPASDADALMHTGVGSVVRSRPVDALHYTFGCQATPVKPMTDEAWSNRAICLGTEISPTISKAALDVRPRTLDRLANSGVRTVVIFEYWTDLEAHADTTHAVKLKRLIKACHQRGLKVLLYFGFLISDRGPEWRDFGHRCAKGPISGYPIYNYRPQPVQGAWIVCLRSMWQDFLVDGIARAMDDYDLDGVYLDGTSIPMACENRHHGCGTVGEDGSTRLTYPIFSVRETMMRLYRVIKQRKADAIINVHQSTAMTIPTIAWATSYWDGEQFGSLSTDKAAADVLSLDAFRAEFMGRQWGVPAEFLCYGKPFSYREAWGFCLLHDVPVRPSHIKPDLAVAESVWKAMDEFDRAHAAWLPYWDNKDYVTASKRHVHVSLYQHPHNGILAVVANLSGKSTKATVRLNPDGLGIDAVGVAHDAIAGHAIKLRDGVIRLPLETMGWKIIRIDPAQRHRP